MKKNADLWIWGWTLALCMWGATATAQIQIRPKAKGSKKVVVQQKTIDAFKKLDISDNLDIILVRGNEASIEIEADDNLIPMVDIQQQNGQLRLLTTQDIVGFKKFSIRVTYTDALEELQLHQDAKITALADLTMPQLRIRCKDFSRLSANIKVKQLQLEADDHAKAEINAKADKMTLQLSKNASVKALVLAPSLQLDLYQKSEVKLEGDVADFRLRLDHYTQFVGKNFSCKTADITTESHAYCAILVTQKATLDMIGQSEIALYGQAAVQLRRFADEAILRKKTEKP